MNNKHCIIIGAGAAGLMAALTAAENHCQVTVLEYLPSPGRKLLSTGAGKCNFTNMLSAGAMTDRFPPDQRRFIRPALLGFPPEKLREFFMAYGVKHYLVDDFYCFPVSDKASDILNVFLNRLKSLKAQIVNNAAVTALHADGERIVGVTAGGRYYPADAVIACGGGPGFPALGGRGSLDKVLMTLGIECVPRVPALCGLKIAESWVGDLTGIVLEKVTVTLDKKNMSCGDLLFTGEGISAPAALDLTGRVARKFYDGEKSVSLKLDLRPEMSREDWTRILDDGRIQQGNKLIKNLFKEYFPQAVTNAICSVAGTAEITAARLDKVRRERLLECLTAMPLTVTATESWNKAFASSGGVARSEVDPKTMRCRKFENLYCAGEFIDVDGPCGGYNLQWAFSSGMLAGSEAAKSL